MSGKYPGWKLVCKVGGKDVYYHKGRARYAIECDGQFLGGLDQGERDILGGILENQREVARGESGTDDHAADV